MLTPTLRSPSDLLNKLERELWRAFHHRHPVHKADHFYNFCITALALKDHFFEAKGVLTAAKATYFQQWNQVSELVASTEVANSTKHFVLRDRKTGALRPLKTMAVSPSTSRVIHVFESQNGELRLVDEAEAPDMSVEFSGGKSVDLYEFMDAVVKYWQKFLASEGVSLSPQAASELYGEET